MNLIEKATIRHYHQHRSDTFQIGTVEALGWRAESSQIKRFEVIATVGDLTGSTLLDIGCGYGDLKGYLDQIYSDFTYIGIDQMPEFISEAKRRYGDYPDTYFYQTDFTTVEFPIVDYVIASGALAYRCQNRDFHFDMIRKMYKAANRAVAFNMLDAARFPEHDLLIGHDIGKIEQFCKSLSRRVKIITGYAADDFTVIIYRD
jgi:trans-aconitate methyltransferase